jgi:hypothetical protein
MYFGTKSYLKSTRNHTAKHALHGYPSEFHLCSRANQKFNSPLTKADVRIQASPSRALKGDNHKIAFMAITHFLDEVSIGIAPMPKMSTF